MKVIKSFYALLAFCFFTTSIFGQVDIKLDFSKPLVPVSPYIYGRNNSLSNFSFGGISIEDSIRLADARVRLLREGGGNNSTKYNWRRKLQSHPDWYNNVYSNDWGIQAAGAQKSFPNAQVMFSFQLIGKAARTNQFNFNDWGYNMSQWWEGTAQNLAGNGVLNNSGTKAKVNGDPNLYLEDWPADSTIGILNNWFNVLKLDKTKLRYWNMDNEPEIWNGTHDDIMPNQLSAEDFMQRYFSVAKKARALYPEIKLVGPVTANEWQWYNWDNNVINYNGKPYTWLEYFIARVAEEQKKTGIRLLDVLDIHFYPGTSKPEEIVQLHRVFFDRDYVFPEANGIKRINGGWDASQNKEYIFGRINDWLNNYLGQNHGVTLGLTEVGINGNDPTITAIWYASTLGEFMKNGVELFTPWSWKTGMWETLHLFSKYNQTSFVSNSSSDEKNVSAYSTINQNKDSVTIALVNRATTTKSIHLTLGSFNPIGDAEVFTLKTLPNLETFYSSTKNALVKTKWKASNQMDFDLSGSSITSILLTNTAITATQDDEIRDLFIYPNPAKNNINIESPFASIVKLELYDLAGKLLEQKLINPTTTFRYHLARSPGIYILRIESSKKTTSVKRIIVQ
ncbi:MAG: glycoside hydrolase family 44 protein [Saprospiraceae bacterium]